jgi:hypothetical protein
MMALLVGFTCHLYAKTLSADRHLKICGDNPRFKADTLLFQCSRYQSPCFIKSGIPRISTNKNQKPATELPLVTSSYRVGFKKIKPKNKINEGFLGIYMQTYEYNVMFLQCFLFFTLLIDHILSPLYQTAL